MLGVLAPSALSTERLGGRSGGGMGRWDGAGGAVGRGFLKTIIVTSHTCWRKKPPTYGGPLTDCTDRLH